MAEPKSRATDRKVLGGTAGVLGAGHVAALLIWILAQFNIEMPMDIAISAITVCAAGVGFIVSWKTQPEGNEQSSREANQAVAIAEQNAKIARLEADLEKSEAVGTVHKAAADAHQEIAGRALQTQPEGA